MAYATRTAPSGVTVLVASGRLNLTSAASLRGQLMELIEAGNTKLVVDFSGADAIDSSGIGALIAALKAARAAGGDLRITAPNEQVQSVLTMTNLSRVLVVHADADGPLDAVELSATTGQ